MPNFFRGVRIVGRYQKVHDDDKNTSKFSFHVVKNKGFVRFERRLDSFHVELF